MTMKWCTSKIQLLMSQDRTPNLGQLVIAQVASSDDFTSGSSEATASFCRKKQQAVVVEAVRKRGYLFRVTYLLIETQSLTLRDLNEPTEVKPNQSQPWNKARQLLLHFPMVRDVRLCCSEFAGTVCGSVQCLWFQVFHSGTGVIFYKKLGPLDWNLGLHGFCVLEHGVGITALQVQDGIENEGLFMPLASFAAKKFPSVTAWGNQVFLCAVYTVLFLDLWDDIRPKRVFSIG